MILTCKWRIHLISGLNDAVHFSTKARNFSKYYQTRPIALTQRWHRLDMQKASSYWSDTLRSKQRSIKPGNLARMVKMVCHQLVKKIQTRKMAVLPNRFSNYSRCAVSARCTMFVYPFLLPYKLQNLQDLNKAHKKYGWTFQSSACLTHPDEDLRRMSSPINVCFESMVQ